MSGIYHRDDIPDDLRAFFVRAEIGLESTPGEFVAAMVEVFREVRRVLKDDGTLWLNLGDSYATAGGAGTQGRNGARFDRSFTAQGSSRKGVPEQLKPKDMIGIPWRVAFALQADGWYLRQDIIWAKANPMPESVRDRCTKAHEYIFLMSKSERYFYDAEAITEPVSPNTHARLSEEVEKQIGSARANGGARADRPMKAVGRKVAAVGSGIKNNDSFNDAVCLRVERRNKRSVWSIATAPFSEAHFATFPPELPEICIKAGSREGDTILDPFGGAGTTGLVADRLGRHCILTELNESYAQMAMRRIQKDGGMLSQVEIVARGQTPLPPLPPHSDQSCLDGSEEELLAASGCANV